MKRVVEISFNLTKYNFEVAFTYKTNNEQWSNSMKSTVEEYGILQTGTFKSTDCWYFYAFP